MNASLKRNRFTFGLGTIGRDMVYTLISMYLMFYLTDVLDLSVQTLAWIIIIIGVCRVFDALNDPIMGLIVDNTRTRYGKFKPWIALGALLSGLLTILVFTNFQITGAPFVALFGLLYLLWGMAFTVNDISYWSMLPSLSPHQAEREKIGSVARICANIGLFFVAAGITPITTAWGEALGSLQQAYFYFAIMLVAIMMIGQCITLFGVKEPGQFQEEKRHTSPRELVRIIVKNDQLLITAVAMALFMIGYCTTTGFGQYFFKYAYGDEGMYTIFALVLGVSQISALAAFPMLGKRFERKTLYTFSMTLIFLGYALFFLAPSTNMLFIGIAGMLIFVGQAFVQVMMLMFLADSVDYGHWKLGKRNDSISFSLQPFINKMGGAVGQGVVGLTVLVSGIQQATSAADVPPQGILMMKIAMLLFPLLCIFVSYVLYRRKYRIDKKMHEQILLDLQARGELNLEGE